MPLYPRPQHHAMPLRALLLATCICASAPILIPPAAALPAQSPRFALPPAAANSTALARILARLPAGLQLLALPAAAAALPPALSSCHRHSAGASCAHKHHSAGDTSSRGTAMTAGVAPVPRGSCRR